MRLQVGCLHPAHSRRRLTRAIHDNDLELHAGGLLIDHTLDACENVALPMPGMTVESRQAICNSIRVYFVNFLLDSLKTPRKGGTLIGL